MPLERKRYGCLTLLLIFSCINSILGMLAGLAVACPTIANCVLLDTVLLRLSSLLPSCVQRGTPSGLVEAVWLGSRPGAFDAVYSVPPRVILITGTITAIELVAVIGIWSWKKWGFHLL